MAIERTLSIIKPDAVSRNLIGVIYAQLEKAGLRIVAAKMMHLSRQQAEDFYQVHKDKPFFAQLVEFMCSAPVMVQVLEGEDAVAAYRTLMGATNPDEAAAGSLRALYAESIDRNVVHGSDSVANARGEINFFFGRDELAAPPKTSSVED